MNGERDRLEAARRQGFLPTLLLLERLTHGATDLGGDVAAADEQLRFRHDPSLHFSSSDVTLVEERVGPPSPGDFTDRPRSRWEVVTTFLGLTGAVTPLPQYMAEEVAQEHRDERTSQAFLDLFHHRALSLLARGLLEQDPAATHLTDRTDPWSRRLLALLGIDPGDGTEPAPLLPDEGDLRWTPLRAAPLLAERALTAAGLEAILRDALAGELAGAALAVEQFVGVRVPVPEPDRTRLGVAASTLGRDVVIGRTVLDRTSTVAVVIGPVGREGFRCFAVEREAARRLRAVVDVASRGDLTAVIELRLAPDAAPPLHLAAQGGSRLGRDTWLGGQRKAARLRVEGAT